MPMKEKTKKFIKMGWDILKIILGIPLPTVEQQLKKLEDEIEKDLEIIKKIHNDKKS